MKKSLISFALYTIFLFIVVGIATVIKEDHVAILTYAMFFALIKNHVDTWNV